MNLLNPLKKARRSRGSALTVVLMVLVILTAMGISLLLITETEMAAGGYERVMTRSFYAAESGIGVASARILVTRNCRPVEFNMSADQLGTNYRLGYNVEVPKVDVLLRVPCNFCPTNEGPDQLYRVIYLMNSRAERRGWAGASASAPTGATLQSEKTILSTIDIMPMGDPPTLCAPNAGGGTTSETNQL